MGVITVFSVPTCVHCRRAKQMLEDAGWEYTEIDLTVYPEKRAAMEAAADRLTVPQVFLNERHLGGAMELEEMMQRADAQEVYTAALAAPNPTGVRGEQLARPETPERPVTSATPSARQEETISIGETSMGYNEMLVQLEGGLEIGSHTSRGITYKRCFTGSGFVDWTVRKHGLKSRAEGVQVGRELLRLGFFEHVSYDHDLKDTPSLYYRLQSQRQPHCLNSRRRWNDRVDDPEVTMRACNNLLLKIEGRHTDGEGVDYLGIASDVEWKDFEDAVCEFQKVDLFEMTQDYRLAFVINLYNLAIRHAFVKVGIPSSDFKRFSFFGTVGYNVGGYSYSFNELENGILRGNRVPPVHFRKLFPKGDPRRAAVLPKRNCAIHFALNCGARSCPAIKFFSGKNVHEELKLAGMGFCELDENVRLDLQKHTLWLTQIASWYSSDFGANKLEIATKIATFLRGEKKATLQEWITKSTTSKRPIFKIRYISYDWSTNAKSGKPYVPSENKDKTTCLIS